VDIVEATTAYEAWLAADQPLVAADLRAKHVAMAEDAFSFMRATFYHWARRWPEICHDLADAPLVLGVGDLHVANFGTWRDREGRLAWGVNDFDEAISLPYTNDLVRLATSVALASAAGEVRTDIEAACDHLLTAYETGLAAFGRPIVLEEGYPSLRALALDQRREPEHFWARLDALAPAGGRVPDEAVTAIARLLPAPHIAVRVAHRSAGLGSLGRQRFVAIGEWHGARFAREAKRLAPSAWRWARDERPVAPHYKVALTQAVRCPDPWVRLCRPWLVRRLAPDCSRIELAPLDRRCHEAELFQAMGAEIANVHLSRVAAVPRVQDDLRRRPAGWLCQATVAMAAATMDDWRAWRDAGTATTP
jgi:hypothetical protein